jgi:hypothetical protein
MRTLTRFEESSERMLKYFSLDSKIKGSIKQKMRKILENIPEIQFAYIHGSFLSDKFRDIDVAVYFEAAYDKKKLLKKELELEELLSRELGYPADVRALNSSPLSFRFNVIKFGEVVFSKNEDLRSDFEAMIISRYHDFAYFRRLYMKEALGIEI